MLKRLAPLYLIGCSAIASGNPVLPLDMPALPVETLSKIEMTVPADLQDGTCLFIIGFSRSSSSDTRNWSQSLEERLPQDSAAVYSVSVLEDVPGLLRGFVVRGIRRGVPERFHDRFLIVTTESQAWKDLASFADPDAAYLVLTNSEHRIVWRTHGPATDEAVQEVIVKVTEIAPPRAEEAGR
ncbi:MAG: hypothetical protein ACREQ8_05010 [Woeseiaceae bacterium]